MTDRKFTRRTPGSQPMATPPQEMVEDGADEEQEFDSNLLDFSTPARPGQPPVPRLSMAELLAEEQPQQ